MWNDTASPKETLLIVLQSELPEQAQEILQKDPDGSHIAFFENMPGKDRILYGNSFLSDKFRDYPKHRLLMVAIDNKVDLTIAIKEDIELIAQNDPSLIEESNRFAMEKLMEMKDIVAEGNADRLTSETLDLVPHFYINATNIKNKTHQVITREVRLKQFQL